MNNDVNSAQAAVQTTSGSSTTIPGSTTLAQQEEHSSDEGKNLFPSCDGSSAKGQDENLYEDLVRFTGPINQQLARYGVKFGVYKDGVYKELLFPFDAVPRVIGAKEWDHLEKGLIQRVKALNAYLKDLYNGAQIISDGVVPQEFAYASKGYLVQCEGIVPPEDVFAHIAGIDLVVDQHGEWFVLEDNLRVPSGASYPLIARYLCRRCDADVFRRTPLVDNRDYGVRLGKVLDYVNRGGINVVVTPGRYNAAYFEHSYLAEKSDAVLAEPEDLYVENNKVYYRSTTEDVRVGTIYRRLNDEYLDPLFFRGDSLIGIPNVMNAYRAGNVAIVNAPGNGAADDKGIYYFVPKMVKYYLNEEPILNNAPTYLPYYPDDLAYVLDHMEDLVIKDVAESGGYGVVFGCSMDAKTLASFKEALQKEPRRFIAQEVVDFQCLPTYIDGKLVPRKADLRAFVLTGKKTAVWPSGLTRYSRDPDNCIVNSSQGGGFKDTWVLRSH